MRIVVIIPTYNEKDSIGAVIDSLEREFSYINEKRAHDFFILVVDGHSPDGTADAVRAKQGQYDNVRLMVEKQKNGIAEAYLSGMNAAINNLQADAYVEFDGDGQHDPATLGDMVAAFDDGADYVIGSRYIPGGSVPQQWSAYRKFLSKVGGMYARFVLELPIKDPTSGLKLSRIKGFAEHISRKPEDLISRHYAYKIQLLHEMVMCKANIAEVPLAFKIREHDVSKSTVRDIFESLRTVTVLRLRHLTSWRLLRMGLVGIAGVVVQTIIFELLAFHWDIMRPTFAAVIGGETAILSNFLLNNYFTFRGHGHPTFNKLARFHMVSLGSVAIQAVLIFATEQVTSDPVFIRIAYATGIIIGFFSNYIGYHLLVWKKHPHKD